MHVNPASLSMFPSVWVRTSLPESMQNLKRQDCKGEILCIPVVEIPIKTMYLGIFSAVGFSVLGLGFTPELSVLRNQNLYTTLGLLQHAFFLLQVSAAVRGWQ